MSEEQHADVLIAGAGLVGLSLAIALRQGLGPSFRVIVADPTLDQILARPIADARASAIIAAGRRLLSTIGVWQEIADAAQPIHAMVITDSHLGDVMRPVFLRFDREVEIDDRQPAEPLAHMVENGRLVETLLKVAKDDGVILRTATVASASYSHQVEASLSDGAVIFAPLVVAADGARSALREGSGITTHGWTYPQSAIVTTVAHERDHDGRAEENFLPAGPFAILPLTGRRSSIVWTETTREAERIVALPDAAFHDELERRFGLHLGDISIAGPRRVYPLAFSVARAFVADRLALVGDAAHVIHPIAGQGLNMGLKDVAALAETIVDAARLGLDIGSPAVLERYQRWRRFDTMAMGAATDGLNRLFSNHSDVLRLVRDVGLGLVDRMPVLKRGFIREAAGLAGDVPKLLRGEAL